MLKRILKIGWGGVCVHVAAMFGIMTAMAILGIDPWMAAGANAAFWTGLEAYQGQRDGKGLTPIGGGWGYTKIAEWLAPCIGGVVMAAQ